jgi:protein SCO1/2
VKFVLAILFASLVDAQTFGRPNILRNIGMEQKMGAQVPLDLRFSDEAGQPVTLRRYIGKPVILAMVYYQCPSLCNMILNGVLRSVKNLNLEAGKDFEIVAVSFDPRETPDMAAAKKQSYIKTYQRPNAAEGWHFLTGEEASSKALGNAVGFRYSYDASTNQYVHPSAVMILTPQGNVSRYFYGIEYPARDIRLGLIEAGNGSIGTPVDQVLLYCFHYDPATGKYGFVIMNVLRLAALLTLGALATFMIVNFRRDFRAAETQRST